MIFNVYDTTPRGHGVRVVAGRNVLGVVNCDDVAEAFAEALLHFGTGHMEDGRPYRRSLRVEPAETQR